MSEDRIASLERQMAVRNERDKRIDERFDRVDHELSKISGWISKLVWLVFTIIIGGLLKLIMDGQINV
jgi:cytoskeletal protein RodZ